MKLSQPKSARVINTSRVLCTLRREGSLSKTDLARALDLNKVSTGEIVDDLLAKGLLCETGKVKTENGRCPTNVEIVKDARYVLCVDIGSKNVTVALCNLLGEIVKIERIPTMTEDTVEQFCVGLIKSCLRTMKLVDQTKIMGIGVAVAGRISIDQKVIISCHYLPWKNIAIADVLKNNLHIETSVFSTSEALVCAEKIYCESSMVSSQPLMYLDWGDHISMAVVVDGKVVINNCDFGHVRVASTGICVCGEIGCLETICATWALSQDKEARLKNLWDKIPENCLPAMAKALTIASQVTGSSRVIVSGEGATIPNEGLKYLQDTCSKLSIERSALGEKANILGCAEFTLDLYFYQRTMLDEMKSWM